MGMDARNEYFVELLAKTDFIKKNLYENGFDGVPLSEKQKETKKYSLQYKKVKEVTEEALVLLNKAQESLINVVKDVKKELIEEKKEKEKVGEAEEPLLETQEELVTILLADLEKTKKKILEANTEIREIEAEHVLVKKLLADLEETKKKILKTNAEIRETEAAHGLLNKAEKSLSNAVNAVKDVKKEETPFTEELLKEVEEKILKAYAEVGEANVLLVEAEAYVVESIYNANQHFVLSVIETICFIYYFYKKNYFTLPPDPEVSKQNEEYKTQKAVWTDLYEKRRKKMEELAIIYVEQDKASLSPLLPNTLYDRVKPHLPLDLPLEAQVTPRDLEAQARAGENEIENLDNQISEIQYEYSDEFINDLFFKCLNYTLVLQDFNNLIQDSIGLLVIQDPVIRLLKAILTVCKEEFEDDFIEIVCNILQHIYSKDPTYKDFVFSQIWVLNYVEEWWKERF